MDTLRTRGKVIVFSFVAVIILFASLLFFQNTATADKVIEFEVNGNGLSYGTLAGVTDKDQEPDLIAAMATSGKQGYVYRTDLEKAEQPAANPVQAVRMMKDQEKRAKEVFSDLLLSEFDARDAPLYDRKFSDRIFDYMANGKLEAAESEVSAAVEKAEIGIEVRDMLYSAFSEANKSLAISIPVYEKNGETIIGEFLVGAF